MTFLSVRSIVSFVALSAALMLAGCSTPPQAPQAPDASARTPVPAPAPTPVVPVEAEPAAPATQPAINFIAATSGPVAAALAYADKVRAMPPAELTSEINRLGGPSEVPLAQVQLALALAQTRNPPDLARAQGLMQRVSGSTTPEGQALAPLARLLAARYGEQRRVEDERDKQAQQARDSQRRIDQLSERLEALRAIERSFSRPGHTAPVPALPANGGAKP
ncbi:hypothetical protein [Variovorax sp.]|uniref:hypothetical protein n=1 Tax=Variovorax sp. TaxID=1871043 RepID=UPI002D58DAB0|nr:hypothetical protein [Variovorax sp.]HYP83440.1 hypothetical protein [Variovorax sp.]